MGKVMGTLDLKQIMDECADIESCKELLTTLKAQKPLGSNYTFYEYKVGPPKREEDTIVRKVNRKFGGFSETGFFCPKKAFYQTSLTFGGHIKVRGLKSECSLIFSEEQVLIVDKLVQLRNEKIHNLSIQPELKCSPSKK